MLEIGYILTQNPVDTVWGEISSLTNPHTRRPLRRRLIMVIRFGGVTDSQQII